ncbi:hypothetical protein [Candidatus Pristimantibacillus sp. PTI5]|uniref:hypothetical protein n=1 Tax=Candidatus Pristimantibacillus sp. PTI5 TaxID=3400422 RepID=UPI003B019DB5
MKIIIIGGKGTAVNIADQITNAQIAHGARHEFLGFCIDDLSLGDSINGYPVLCNTQELLDKFGGISDVKFIFALYKPEKMKERTELLASYRIPATKFCNFIHPTSYLSSHVDIGFGNVILSHCSIHSNVKIGNFNIINSNVVVEHDSSMKNNNYLAASACVGSNIQLDNGIFIGLNSAIRENVTLHDYAFVGMGSNVLTDVKPNAIVFGNPARSTYDNRT